MSKEIILKDLAMEQAKSLPPSGDHLTPKEIVAELDKYIVGQE